MPKVSETLRDVTFIDIFHCMEYLQDHYNATTQITYEKGEAPRKHSVLHVETVARCGVPRHPPVVVRRETILDYQMLPRLPAILLGELYDIIERLDGICPHCIRTRGY